MKAIDLLKKLQENPEYVAREQSKQEDLEKKEKEIQLAEVPFITEVQDAGFREIKQSSDLLKCKSIPEKLVNILIRWIPQTSNSHQSKEILIRALAKSELAFDGKFLIDLFDSDRSPFSLKWAIGNTIASGNVLNVDKWIEEKLISLDQGKQNEMLVYAAIKYFTYSKSHILLRDLFHSHPLQVADAFTFIGKKNDLEFLTIESDKYKGVALTRINKSLNILKKKLNSKDT